MEENFLNKVNNAYKKGLKPFEKATDYINGKVRKELEPSKTKEEKELELV